MVDAAVKWPMVLGEQGRIKRGLNKLVPNNFFFFRDVDIVATYYYHPVSLMGAPIPVD